MRIEPFLAPGLRIEDTLEDGRGLARLDGRVIFVEGGVPGDVVDVWIYGKQRRQLLGRVQHLVQPSADRVTPECQHFSACGGCKWQHLSYDAQLAFKEKQVRDALQRIGGLEDVPVLPILPAEEPYFYRNKLEFTFSNRRWLTREQMQAGEQADVPGCGFHVAGAFDKILPVDRCHLQDDRINPVRNAVVAFATAQGWAFYDHKQQQGWLRNLVFRTSRATGEILLMLIVSEPDTARIDQLFQHLEAQFPYLTSLLWLHNPKKNDSYSDLQPVAWKGPAGITEQLFDKQFFVSPTSFFQTNTAQAERLYGVVRDYFGAPVAHAWDLYCGAGSIGITLADKAQKFLGIEYVQSAVEDAHVNIELNKLTGYIFIAGDIAKLLTDKTTQTYGKPDVIVTDPPRAGMDERVVKQLLSIECPRIVYVSCNPATQARDLALLSEKYTIEKVQPVDMFPHTSHVEAVALLTLRS